MFLINVEASCDTWAGDSNLNAVTIQYTYNSLRDRRSCDVVRGTHALCYRAGTNCWVLSPTPYTMPLIRLRSPRSPPSRVTSSLSYAVNVCVRVTSLNLTVDEIKNRRFYSHVDCRLQFWHSWCWYYIEVRYNISHNSSLPCLDVTY